MFYGRNLGKKPIYIQSGLYKSSTTTVYANFFFLMKS